MSELDALDSRTAHWRQVWSIPNSCYSITGFSRAAYRTGFYIPELNIMLDAGPYTVKNPDHIFITHNHVDHVAGLPFTLFRTDDTQRYNIHAPLESENHIKKYVASMFELNGLLTEPYDPTTDRYTFHGYSEPTSLQMTLKKTAFQVDVILCDHTVPTVSYCFSEIRTKLKDEYVGLSGQEIRELKQKGCSIVHPVKTPVFAYVCDTTVNVLDQNPQLLTFPVIFIECTFLYPHEHDLATSKKHVHWELLRPYVLANTRVLFVLIHFSLRYTEDEVLEFFRKERDLYSIHNIKIWAGDTSEAR